MALRFPAFPGLALCLGTLLGSCHGAPHPSDAGRRFEIPEGVTAPWAALSPEGLGWAYTELRRSEAFMVVNGRRRGPYG